MAYKACRYCNKHIGCGCESHLLEQEFNYLREEISEIVESKFMEQVKPHLNTAIDKAKVYMTICNIYKKYFETKLQLTYAVNSSILYEELIIYGIIDGNLIPLGSFKLVKK